MRSLRRVRSYKEWRSSHDTPPVKDYFAWLDNSWLQHALFGIFLLPLGFFAQNTSVGMVLTGLYGAAALGLRLPSAVSFKIAFVGIISLPVLTFVGQQELVGIYAQYVFLLLCIGTVGALVEQWRRNDSSFEVGLSAYAKVGAGGRSAI